MIAATMLDVRGDLKDFSETAALIENLDLVVTIDSAVAHLAGAMGRPVWLLLSGPADWRWMLARRSALVSQPADFSTTTAR